MKMAPVRDTPWDLEEDRQVSLSPAEKLLTLAVRSLAEGHTEALDTIWDLCTRDLYGLALWRTGSTTDAEDAVQEVFLRLARSPRSLAQARRPRAYLLAMAHRAAVDALRRRPRALRQADRPLLAPATDPGRAADAERASRLAEGLPAKQRTVLFLRLFAELSFADIGRVTGVATFTAASRYRLAIRRLRKRMGVDS
jgi:RNA polymerase sigma-70 factor, ECF subfamily